MPRPSDPPTDLPSLFSWISSSPPYSSISHSTTPFIDPNDFTRFELESALRYAVSAYEAIRDELETALIQKLQDPDSQGDHDDTLQTLKETTRGPVEDIEPRVFGKLALAAKFAGDMMFEICLVGLATGIQKLKAELQLLEAKDSQEIREEGRRKESGDGDDWFLVGRDEGNDEAKEATGLIVRAEDVEGDIEVRLEVCDR